MPSGKQIAVIAAGFLLIIIMVLSVIIPVISGLGTNPLVNVEGIYEYSGGWTKINSNGTVWLPRGNGTYLIYFRNLNCPACQQFDPIWSQYFKDYLFKSPYKITPVEVVCTYFSGNCQDPSAKALFSAFENALGQYFGTPYLVLISNGTFLYFSFPPTDSTGAYSAQLLNQTISSILYEHLHPQTNTTTPSTNTTSS
ncbi:MAG: hypothetical protein ACP5I2_04770 [Fervidicoccaceae archaeon]|jgi:hypothetical protein